MQWKETSPFKFEGTSMQTELTAWSELLNGAKTTAEKRIRLPCFISISKRRSSENPFAMTAGLSELGLIQRFSLLILTKKQFLRARAAMEAAKNHRGHAKVIFMDSNLNPFAIFRSSNISISIKDIFLYGTSLRWSQRPSHSEFKRT